MVRLATLAGAIALVPGLCFWIAETRLARVERAWDEALRRAGAPPEPELAGFPLDTLAAVGLDYRNEDDWAGWMPSAELIEASGPLGVDVELADPAAAAAYLESHAEGVERLATVLGREPTLRRAPPIRSRDIRSWFGPEHVARLFVVAARREFEADRFDAAERALTAAWSLGAIDEAGFHDVLRELPAPDADWPRRLLISLRVNDPRAVLRRLARETIEEARSVDSEADGGLRRLLTTTSRRFGAARHARWLLSRWRVRTADPCVDPPPGKFFTLPSGLPQDIRRELRMTRTVLAARMGAFLDCAGIQELEPDPCPSARTTCEAEPSGCVRLTVTDAAGDSEWIGCPAVPPG